MLFLPFVQKKGIFKNETNLIMDEFAIFILLFLAISIGGHLIDSYLKIKLKSVKPKDDLADSETIVNSMQNKIEFLINENEEMREELRNIKYLLSQDKRLIDIKDYDQEQIRLDKDTNKFEY